MSTNNKNEHGMSSCDDAPQPQRASLSGEQCMQQDVTDKAGANAEDQFVPPGTRRAHPSVDRIHPQTSAHGPVPAPGESKICRFVQS